MNQLLSQPRAKGALKLEAVVSPRGTELRNLRQSGSLRAMFPRSQDLTAVLVNTAGGVTGGDRFDVSVFANDGAAVVATSQAAERAYRAQPDQIGRVHNRLRVGADARLCWLPQETILFDGCNFAREMSVDLTASSRFLMVEPVVFGRSAMGEVLNSASFTDQVRITRGDDLLYFDRVVLCGDIHDQLARPFVTGGAMALATVIYVGPDAAGHIGPVRAQLPETAGASLLRDDLLIMRIVASDSHILRRDLIPILTRLNGAALPRPWMM